MKTNCRQIQRTLAERGPEALRADEQAQDHVAECGDCFAFLEALAEVDAGLARLEPVDAPDQLVEELLAAVTLQSAPQSRESVIRLFAYAFESRFRLHCRLASLPVRTHSDG